MLLVVLILYFAFCNCEIIRHFLLCPSSTTDAPLVTFNP